MLWYFVTAVVAFSCGFLAAALLAAGRRCDTARAGDILAHAVDSFAAEHDERQSDVGRHVSVPRDRLDQLQRALAVHDELRSA